MPASRQATFAGRFYPAAQQQCDRMLDEMYRPVELERRPLGAVVPHAGWIYSGPTAALALAGVAHARPQTVVIFGAVHVFDANEASLYPNGSWETPLGPLPVDQDLATRVARCRQITIDPDAHQNEHSIEVQLPLIRRILGNVSILPISVRPGRLAAEIGRACAVEIAASDRRVVFLASTDLTHYGPAFGFEPHGRGEAGVRWAKEVNDRRFVDLISALDAEAVVPEAAANHNACGAGAVAAAISAARESGADGYLELEHTTSAERELAEGGRPVNSVGYEAGVFTLSH
ncbi:MAG: AmmeMemoRadiSam system protein B [Phycisphaerae bacterium]